MQPLVFRYPPLFIVLVVLGAPLLPMLAVLLPSASIFVLIRTHLSLELWLHAAVAFGLGIVFAWVAAMFFRTWYSVITDYTVDEVGINIKFLSDARYVTWSELRAAHYRRLVGQLELRFEPLTRLVVLTNVDLDWERRTVLAARRFVEDKTAIEVKQSIL